MSNPKTKKFDFSGWATKVNLQCDDGRVILPNAFAHQHGKRVPLCWEHLSDDPTNVLGHAVLENQQGGVYARCVFYNTPKAQAAKEAVAHGAINQLSIYANKLKETNRRVQKGHIVEVSLVKAGANPGARIDNLTMAHSAHELDMTEAFITTGTEFKHSLKPVYDYDDYLYHSDDESFDDLEFDFEDDLEVADDGYADFDEPDLSTQHSAPPTRTHRAKASYEPQTIRERYEALSPEDQQLVKVMVQHASGADAGEDNSLAHAEGQTIRERYNSLSQADKQLVLALVAQVAAPESDEARHSGIGGPNMKRNTFDTFGDSGGMDGMTDTITAQERKEILHSAIATAKANNGKLSEAVLEHAMAYGIENIEILFPEARAVDGATPELVQREKGWITKVMSGMRKVPFSKIKSMSADITKDEARAKGYIAGNKKWDEVFAIMTRTTDPQTVYSRQAIDRDDMIDITDFDVIAWIRGIQRIQLNEELARAVLVGDDRPIESKDRVKPAHIRPVWTDDDFYTYKVKLAANITTHALINEITSAGQYYEGNGEPAFWTTRAEYTAMQLVEDANGRRLYATRAELAAALGVSEIIDVPVMRGQTRTDAEGDRVALVGLLLDITDYTMGANRGGEINAFDDFDIDYNQYKYLYETRVAGALTKWRTAVAIERRVNSVG